MTEVNRKETGAALNKLLHSLDNKSRKTVITFSSLCFVEAIKIVTYGGKIGRYGVSFNLLYRAPMTLFFTVL